MPGVAALRSSSAAPLVVALGVDDLLVAPWQDDATGNVAVQTLDGHQLTATVIGRAPGTGLTVLRADQSLPGLDVGACANMTTGSVIDVAAGRETFTGRISETYTLVALLDGPPIGPAIRIELERPAPTTGAPVILHGGKVIAIVVATADHALYAVPVEVATTSARSLAGGDRSLAWLGIGGNDTNAGPTITEVERSSPAALAGLKAGDVIEAFDATSVGSMWSVLVHVRSVSVGSTVVVAVRRDGIRLELRVVLTALNVA